ncbi:spore germination protein KB [Paenibacillus tianmuensis]|uniref:Spore germination protein KB n=1 Tax=Paenibacillus tianmuensis TaxID=624147 RepID=A0A1G4PML1_9BACL|nr:endospore germination permease [Paenibacillus tianmuensis]SCW33564.1 spore germination protein KB [Paenibacillus tianmuensis]
MRITSRSLFWLIISMQLIMNVIFTIGPAMQLAKQDAWFSLILAVGLGVGIAWLCGKLGTWYPGLSVIEYSPRIIGKWGGRFIGYAYLCNWLLISGIILHASMSFLTTTILHRTPLWVGVSVLLIACLYAVYKGIPTIARLGELVCPFIIIGTSVPLFLSLNHVKMDLLLPVLTDNSVLSLIQGSMPLAEFLGDCIAILVLSKFVTDPERIVKHVVLGVGLSGFVTFVAGFLILIVFGSNVGMSYSYPYYGFIRYISIAGFIENIDAVVIAIWISSMFIKISLYLFLASYSAAQLFHITNWRKVIAFIALPVLVIAILPRNSVQVGVTFPQKVAAPFLLPVFSIAIPLMLFLTALVKRRKKRSSA